MQFILSDLRLALRGLRRNPLFATVAILSLALGIGANTAIFTLIDQVLLRKLPVTRADELVMLYQEGLAHGQQHGVADALLPDLSGHPAEGRAARGGALPAAVPASISVDNRTERVEAEMVSGNYFSMLGVKPALGRVFSSQEDDQVFSGHPVVVLSHDYWTTRFASDPGVVGKKILVNDYPMDDRRRVGGGVRRHRSGAVAADCASRS